MSKSDKVPTTTKKGKENYLFMTLMKIDANFLSKILGNQNQEHSKKFIHYGQFSSQRCRNGLIYVNKSKQIRGLKTTRSSH